MRERRAGSGNSVAGHGVCAYARGVVGAPGFAVIVRHVPAQDVEPRPDGFDARARPEFLTRQERGTS